VLRTKVDPQATLFESMLPDEFRRPPPGLSAVDRLLDDPVFFEPFVCTSTCVTAGHRSRSDVPAPHAPMV
jgi:hypothetical protein